MELTTMILFFTVTIIVTFLYIYVKKYIIQRQAIRRGAAIFQLSTDAVSVVHVHQPVDINGLDQMVNARLPIFPYKRKQTDEKAANNSVEECSVCLSFLEEEEMVKALPNCRHIFHVMCIDMWLMANPTCPICRTMAEPRIPEELALQVCI